jgi:zinc/manganese transport system substrate-binding protein
VFSSRHSKLLFSVFSIFLLLIITLTACGSESSNTSTGSSTNTCVGNVAASATTTPTASVSSGPVQVAAAENFWGSIASQVGGSHVQVTNIIADPNADPHDYEPTSADAKTITDAKYVIFNGAGYDPWVDKLLEANPASGRAELNIGKLNGKEEGDNPHMWYNPDYVTAVATKIRDDLKAIDPTDASAIDQSAQTFLTTGLQHYHELIASIKATYQGTPVGATESIFSYLAPALGLNVITPCSYLTAVSEGTDITPADKATVNDQIDKNQIKVLIYNSQNTPNDVQDLINRAKDHHIPVATVTETPNPPNATFQDWQSTQLEGIKTALAQAIGK